MPIVSVNRRALAAALGIGLSVAAAATAEAAPTIITFDDVRTSTANPPVPTILTDWYRRQGVRFNGPQVIQADSVSAHSSPHVIQPQGLSRFELEMRFTRPQGRVSLWVGKSGATPRQVRLLIQGQGQTIRDTAVVLTWPASRTMTRLQLASPRGNIEVALLRANGPLDGVVIDDVEFDNGAGPASAPVVVSASAGTPVATAGAPAAASTPAQNPPAGGPLPDLVVTRRDSLSLPMRNGGPLVFDMMNVGNARSEGTSIRVAWDGKPGQSFFVPPLAPGQRTGLRKVVPDGVSQLRVELNPGKTFAEARTDNNVIEETVGVAPAPRAQAQPPPPAQTQAPTPAQSLAPQVAAPESMSVAQPPTVEPPVPQPGPEREPDGGGTRRLPTGWLLPVAGILALAGVVAAVLAMARRGPQAIKPRIVPIPEFQARLITGDANVRKTPAGARLAIATRETVGESPGIVTATSIPNLWEIFDPGEHLSESHRTVLDSSVCFGSIRAGVGIGSELYWEQVRASLLSALRTALALPLDQILWTAWGRSEAVQSAVADSRGRPGQDITVPAEASRVTATHHVHVAAELDGKPVQPGMDFIIETICALEACSFVVRGGRIARAEVGRATVEGVMRCGLRPLFRREPTPLELPRFISMDRVQETADAAVDEPEWPAGDTPVA